MSIQLEFEFLGHAEDEADALAHAAADEIWRIFMRAETPQNEREIIAFRETLAARIRAFTNGAQFVRANEAP